jgi:hypothetical protein
VRRAVDAGVPAGEQSFAVERRYSHLMKRHFLSVVFTATVACASITALSVPLLGSVVAAASSISKSLPAPPWSVGGFNTVSSCVKGPVCVSMGWNHHGATFYTWAARFQDGKWTRLSAPPEGAVAGEGASAISCTTNTWCMVTGTNGENQGNKPIAEELIGTHWTTLPVPNVKGSIDFSIYKLSCQSSKWCVGVGTYAANKPNYSDATFLVSEVWNGTTWRFVPIDSPRTNAPLIDPGMVAGGEHPTGDPQQISCVSKKFCMIMGSLTGPFVEQWNGRRWSTVAAPDALTRPASDSEFWDGTCLSKTFCVAVGGYPVSNAAWRPLIEQWDGHSWQIVTLPRLPQYFNGKPGFNLTGVECASTKFCEAYGDQTVANSGVNGLMWNGRTWHYVATGNRATSAWTCLTNSVCEFVD